MSGDAENLIQQHGLNPAVDHPGRSTVGLWHQVIGLYVSVLRASELEPQALLVLLAATKAPVFWAVVYNHFRHVVLSNAAYSSNMKLYITETSPYARIVRVVLLEKGLGDRVEILVAQTRVSDSPYYSINPSGRVPYLIRDDDIALEESALICAYLDQLDEKPAFDPPDGEQAWEARRLEALARSLLDGLAVWGRELRRPWNERSPTILEHEAHRSVRMADLWALQIDHPLMRGALNMAQITLACALGLEARSPHLRWRPGHPKLSAWFDAIATRLSLAATAPPAPG